MNYYEALRKCDKLNLTLHVGTETGHASIVRILPRDIDPPKEGDNGWDVEINMD